MQSIHSRRSKLCSQEQQKRDLEHKRQINGALNHPLSFFSVAAAGIAARK